MRLHRHTDSDMAGETLGPLLTNKHEKYFKFCLQSFPSKVQSEDANKLALIYFCLHGLSLLNKLNLSSNEQKDYSEFIYSHKIEDPKHEIESFRSSGTFKLPSVTGSYDLPNLSATFFALLNLLALGSDYSKTLDREKIMKFILTLQVKKGEEKGAFRAVLGPDGEPIGETDVRFCYMALAIRKLLKYDEIPSNERKHDVNTKSLQDYILDRLNFDGGFSSNRWTESQSGLTFCSLASLRLIDYNFENQKWPNLTIDWLVHRQVDYPKDLYNTEYEYYDDFDIGGFNGRPNKFSDTCYAWWVTGSLNILDPKKLNLLNLPKAGAYLLNHTQNKLVGGFGKNGESSPDPFHTFLALASLSLWKNVLSFEFPNSDQITSVDGVFVITKESKVFWEEVVCFA
ncbi:uncharacterized protein PRCAT00000422001 [Priceomyces carsonii]|uniref:uncharacterized protein n=1 Tax=Priceomyces carsonii TaxID=28549 RepID=UPI002ED9351A|nr:unnamed protein product [Priceomyces carsonii]